MIKMKLWVSVGKNTKKHNSYRSNKGFILISPFYRIQDIKSSRNYICYFIVFKIMTEKPGGKKPQRKTYIVKEKEKKP